MIWALTLGALDALLQARQCTSGEAIEPQPALLASHMRAHDTSNKEARKHARHLHMYVHRLSRTRATEQRVLSNGVWLNTPAPPAIALVSPLGAPRPCHGEGPA